MELSVELLLLRSFEVSVERLCELDDARNNLLIAGLIKLRLHLLHILIVIVIDLDIGLLLFGCGLILRVCLSFLAGRRSCRHYLVNLASLPFLIWRVA